MTRHGKPSRHSHLQKYAPESKLRPWDRRRLGLALSSPCARTDGATYVRPQLCRLAPEGQVSSRYAQPSTSSRVAWHRRQSVRWERRPQNNTTGGTRRRIPGDLRGLFDPERRQTERPPRSLLAGRKSERGFL